jgi:ferredoxin
MPDPSRKNPKNAPGPWYVDLSCVACDTCTDISPEIFGRGEDRAAFVREHRPAEADLFRFALESCPTEAIGDDGG